MGQRLHRVRVGGPLLQGRRPSEHALPDEARRGDVLRARSSVAQLIVPVVPHPRDVRPRALHRRVSRLQRRHLGVERLEMGPRAPQGVDGRLQPLAARQRRFSLVRLRKNIVHYFVTAKVY